MGAGGLEGVLVNDPVSERIRALVLGDSGLEAGTIDEVDVTLTAL